MKFKISTQKDRDTVADYVKNLSDSKQYDVSVTVRKTVRTMQQNRLYFLWLNCIANETGNDKDTLHEYFSDKYLPKVEVKIFGEVIEQSVSTTSLDTAQFKTYLDRIQMFAAAELGIILPDPNEAVFEQFREYYENFI